AVAGRGRGLAAAVAGGVAGFLAGAWAASWLGAEGVWANVGVTLLAAVAALAVGGGVVTLVDRDDARAVAGVLGRRPPGG
ncbi:virulence factor MviN, partial [Nonomuraea sp. MCN248]|nr:virulence factor MviN [Nonomuraea corallina]